MSMTDELREDAKIEQYQTRMEAKGYKYCEKCGEMYRAEKCPDCTKNLCEHCDGEGCFFDDDGEETSECMICNGTGYAINEDDFRKER